MTWNKKLLLELDAHLKEIKINIKSNYPHLYRNELDELHNLVRRFISYSNQANSLFEKNEKSEKTDIIKCIMKIIKQIDNAIQSVEISMHGVENYSNYERIEIKNIEFQQMIKEKLTEMLNKVAAAFPRSEVKDDQLEATIKRTY